MSASTQNTVTGILLPNELTFFYSMHEYTYSVSFEKTKMKKKTEKIELNSEISIVFMYGYVHRHLSRP